ncbi:GNAT family N-acetyltransferase [Tolypothrix campylonemoides VB511288]|nr:GNAT family N-acetyltransferase [Tolypothrix campylonemoides VB511288]
MTFPKLYESIRVSSQSHNRLDAGVAGIYYVATLPKARRQGFATALVLAALHKARALKYSVGTLQALQMGVNVYTQIGFQE